MSVIPGAGDFKCGSGKLYFPFQLSGDAELNPFREVADVGDNGIVFVRVGFINEGIEQFPERNEFHNGSR
jgi:hypothetical protein